MSWNIKTPGDYINGPLTVAGAANFQSNLAVGIASATSRLHVVGGSFQNPAILDTTGYNHIILRLNGADRGQLFADSTYCFGVVNSANSAFRFLVTDSGNVLAGTTNNFASSRLCVQGTAGTSTPDVTIGTPVNSGGNTNLAIGRSAATNGYVFLDAYKAAVGGTELVLNAINGGSVLVGLSSVNANGGCLQLKSGITLPATQVASTDANTLDDYEEGTWTPTISAGSGTPTTVTINSAGYTKIGRQVTLHLDFSIIDKGTANGVFLFSLPFTSSASFAPAGSFKESSVVGYMGPIYYVSTAYAGLVFYNDTVIWTNNYRVRGTYTYTV